MVRYFGQHFYQRGPGWIISIKIFFNYCDMIFTSFSKTLYQIVRRAPSFEEKVLLSIIKRSKWPKSQIYHFLLFFTIILPIFENPNFDEDLFFF